MSSTADHVARSLVAGCRVAALLAALSATRRARAAEPVSSEPTATERQAKLVEAQRARETGDHQAALATAERAGELRMTASLRRFIAEEQVALGLLVAGYESALRCGAEAPAEPGSSNRELVLAGCNELAEGLLKRLASVRLEFAQAVPEDCTIALNERREACAEAANVGAGSGAWNPAPER